MPAVPANPSVDVVVLNWNGRDYLPACLDALQQQTFAPAKIVVVDNGSTDDSLPWLRHTHPTVDIIDIGANVGFAAGNNVAIRSSAANIVALVNPDVILSPDWLAQVVATFAGDARIGIVGGKLWYPDGRTIQHGGGYLRPPQAMPGHYALGETDTGQADEPRDVEYVIGGATAIRREVVAGVGLLDEGYFLYYEDVDYCARARRAGWRVVYAPAATAVHIESATAVKGSFSYLGRFHTGRWRTLLKHMDGRVLVEETVPVERAWLSTLSPDERLAAALATQQALAGWDEVMVARVRDGAAALDPETAAAVRSALPALRDEALALPGPPVMAGYLARHSAIDAPTFASSIPLVAAFRTAWNNLAARDYLAPLLAQQNAVNEALAAEVTGRRVATEEAFARLAELQAIHAALAEETRMLALQAREAREVLGQVSPATPLDTE